MAFKFNPFTGQLEIVKPDNFSYNYIKPNTILCVPLYQQMVVAEHLDIYGDINLKGDLVIL